MHRFIQFSLVLATILVAGLPRPASAEPFCPDCEVHLGIGGTYHYWGKTDGVVLPLTVSWDRNRYEVGVFRMASPQSFEKSGTTHELAQPYWGVSASRRWTLFESGPVRTFFGFGMSYRTESDNLSATRWDFASQLGLHYRLPRRGSAVELAIRHWSNAGIKQPNHGQDFATLTFTLDPTFFRSSGFGQARERDPPFTVHR